MLVESWFRLKVRKFLSHFLFDFFHPPFKTAHLLPKLVRGSLISLKLSHAPSSCFTFSALGELGELLREGERGVIHNKTYSHTAGQKESANNALTLLHRKLLCCSVNECKNECKSHTDFFRLTLQC